MKTKSKTIRDLSLAIVGALIFVNTFSSTARAQVLTLVAGGSNQKCSMNATYNWNGMNGMISIPPPNAAIPNPWSGNIIAVRLGGGGAGVQAELQHNPGDPPCDDNHGVNNKPLTFTVGAEPNPLPPGPKLISNTKAGQVDHGQHFDLGRLTTNVNIDGAGIIKRDIIVEIQHRNDIQPLVKTSYTNPTPRSVKISITPDYRKGDKITDDTTQTITTEVESKKKIELGPFKPKLADGSVLASWSSLVLGSAKTETNLAFLGTVNEFFTELDFGSAVSLFAGNNEFFVPDLRPANGDETLELFVGVDLSQWLGSEFTFDAGDVFSLTNGVSDLLPGILVGTSPVTLGTSGFQTDNPYDLPVKARGVFDGKIIVPEPTSTLSLLALGTIGAASTLKRKLKPSKPSEKETTKVS